MNKVKPNHLRFLLKDASERKHVSNAINIINDLRLWSWFKTTECKTTSDHHNMIAIIKTLEEQNGYNRPTLNRTLNKVKELSQISTY